MPAKIEATAELQWPLVVSIVHPGGDTITLDSASLHIEVLGALARQGPPLQIDLSRLFRVPRSVAPGDTFRVSASTQASDDSARLVIRVAAHDGSGRPLVLEAATLAGPGPFQRAHPSEFLSVGGRRVEYVHVGSPPDSGRRPAVLLVHGHGGNARRMLRTALLLSQRGYVAGIMSMPGYGGSTGPADYMGPVTLAAAEAALERLASSPDVDRSRLAAWGVSRGGNVVAALAERRRDLVATVGQSGVYDMWALYRGTDIEGIPENMVAEAGRDSAAWRMRSPVYHVERFHGALLVLHGDRDLNVPIGQARGFAAAARARGIEVEEKYFPQSYHQLPRLEVFQTVFGFLGRKLRTP